MAYMSGSLTMPPLPTCPGCSSNCGLTKVSKVPPAFSKGTTAGKTSVWEMKDKSATTKSNAGAKGEFVLSTLTALSTAEPSSSSSSNMPSAPMLSW